MQLWNMGYYNSVSTGGKKISRIQKNKLVSLGVDLVFCFDKDVLQDEIETLAQDFQGVNVFMMIDNENILNEKESPSDNYEKWIKLLNRSVTKIKGV
jgi:DNA primase